MRRFALTLFVLLAALAFAVPGIATAASAPPPTQAGGGLLAQLAIQQAELSDPSAAYNDYFGGSVALSGDTALVSSLSGAGVVYVYTRTGATWTQQTELTASDAAAGDGFGGSLALDGDTALIGACWKTVGGQSGAGAVYVFTRSGTSWSQRAELSAPDPAVTRGFGGSVALSGDSALIGAAGAAYVFTGAGASWSQQAELSDPEATAGDLFGYRVALSGDTALVSACWRNLGAQTGAGAVYVYTRTGTSWSAPTELTAADAATNDYFGSSLALSGDTALVGAYDKTVSGQSGAGAVYVFTRTGTTWSQKAELTDPDAAIEDFFGNSVALDGDTALIGAWCKSVGSRHLSGAAYVYTGAGASWSAPTELTAADAAAYDQFGWSVALSGETALVGAAGKIVGGHYDVGAAYVEVLGSSDDTLSNLTVSAGSLSPSFAPSTLSYSDSVANKVSAITVTPTTDDPNASYTLKWAGIKVTNPITLNVGANVIDVVVTAPDGSSTKTYAVTVTRAKSSDDRLASLTVSVGTLTPDFAPDTLNYSDQVANDVSSINVSGTLEDSNANGKIEVGGNPVSNPIPLKVGANVIDIVVTAQDGITSQTYSVTVTRAKSSDDTLKSLVVSAGELSPSFSPDTLEYSDGVAHKVTDITVSATPNDADATCALEVGGVRVDNPIALSEEGDTVIDIVVTAQDGATSQTYSVTVGRLSNDASLSDLTVSAGELSPSFAPDTLDYADEVANRVTSIVVTATPHDENATCAIEADGEPVVFPFFLMVGANVIDVVVTAEDGTSQSYSLTVTRAPSSDDSLKSLTVSAGSLSPSFTAAHLTYTDSVANSVNAITLTATTNDSAATYVLKLSGSKVTNPIALNVGDNVIDVVVTAADGSRKTYSVTVTRAQSSDDTLKSLTVSAGTLSPSFTAAHLTYTDSVANSVSAITVTPTVNESHASYVLKVGGTTVTNPIALDVGANVIDVVVTAQDGSNQTYSLTVTRAAPLIPNLTLKLSGLTSGSLKLGKMVTTKGTVTPASLAGGKVKLTVQRKQNGSWRKVSSLTPTIASSGTYSATYKPAKRGSYRIKAKIAATATHTAAATAWRTFKVK